MNNLSDAGLFLIRTIFDFYIFIVALRVVLQGFGADFYNPLCQAVIKWTEQPIKLLRPILPAWQYVDAAVLVFLILLEAIKFSLLFWLQTQYFPHPLGILLISCADIFKQLLDILFYASLLVVILSWINPLLRNPMVDILLVITLPLFNWVRRITPNLGGIDLSPALVLIILKLLEMLLIKPLFIAGVGMLNL